MTTSTSLNRTKKARIYKVTNGVAVHLIRAFSRSQALKSFPLDARIATQDELVTWLPQVEIIDATIQSDL